MAQPEKFDVFLSHNSKDKPAVEEIARRLIKEYGLKCWFDKWNLTPGKRWQDEIEVGLENSQSVTVFLGEAGMGKWENAEMRVALDACINDGTRSIIPVLLPGAPVEKLSSFLKQYTWVDFRNGLDDRDALYRLYCGIKGIAPGADTAVRSEEPSAGDLPLGSYIPFPRNALFTGRVKDLEILANALLNNDRTGIVVNQAITGMGGLGKTQLAVEFAYQYGCRFEGVHWLDLRDPQVLDSQIALCGQMMGLPAWPAALPDQVTATLRAWLTDPPHLLVLDNFESLENANEVLARLRHSGLKLLLTSRRSDWPAALGLQRLPLEEFTPQESHDFLRKYLPDPRATDADIHSLADHLGYLPLALELAGRYIEKHPHLPVNAYLAQLEKALEHASMQNWKPEQKSLTGHDLSLLQTFALSWEQVTDKTTQRIFISAGYCAANTPIPLEILQTGTGEESVDCDECLSNLIGFGLLKEGPSIHPLLAQFAQRFDDKERAALKSLGENLAKLANQKNADVDRTGHYSLFQPILPHVRAVAGNTEHAGIPVAGNLWNSLGYHISDMADYAGAKAAYERALTIFEKQLGQDHPNVATLINNLGGVLQELGDLAGAKAAYERALKIFKKFLPPGHPYIKSVQGNLDSLK